jgi:hypothetical protein
MHIVLACLIAAALAGDDVPSTILSRDGQKLWTAATDAVVARPLMLCGARSFDPCWMKRPSLAKSSWREDRRGEH